MAIPSSADRVPVLDRRGFNCPHCGVFAQQTWETIAYKVDHEGDAWPVDLEPHEGPPMHPSEPDRWRGARCGACDQWSLWRDGSMVYPPGQLGSPPHADMPSEVRELYIEAAAVAVVSRRAGAALARATLERLIKLIDPDTPAGATLETRIGRLQDRVSTPLRELLEVVRYVGNKMLHVEEQPGELVVLALDDQEGPALLELLLEAANDLVDELITRPATVANLRDRLPDQVRAKLAGGASSRSGAAS